MNNWKNLLRKIWPGIRFKLSFFTTLFVFLFLGVVSILFYQIQKNTLEENLEREIKAPISYINRLVLDIDNLSRSLVLVEDFKFHVEEKKKELSQFKTTVVYRQQSFYNRMQDFWKAVGLNAQYKLAKKSVDTYYSRYLSDAEIKELESKIKSQFVTSRGTSVSEPSWKELQAIARQVSVLERQEKQEKKSSKALLGSQARLRNRIQKFFQEDFKTNIEERGFNSLSIRIQSVGLNGEVFLDTDKIVTSSEFQGKPLFADPNFLKFREGLFKIDSLEKISEENFGKEVFKVGRFEYEVETRPIYRNPISTAKAALILQETNRFNSSWKQFLEEDKKLCEEFKLSAAEIAKRLEELRKDAKVQPAKDPQFASLVKKYSALLEKREGLFKKLNPNPSLEKTRIENLKKQVSEISAKIKGLEKTLEEIRKLEKKNVPKEESLEEEIEKLEKQKSLVESSFEDWSDSKELQLSSAIYTLRNSLLLEFVSLPFRLDSNAYLEYLQNDSYRRLYSARISNIRNWILQANSELDLPKFYFEKKLNLPLENAILSRSRSEAEEFMWKLDATPIANWDEALKKESISYKFLESNLSGFNLVLIDRTASYQKIRENRTNLLKIAGGIGCFAILLSFFFSNLLVKKLKMISKNATEVGNGNLEIEFPKAGWDEIGDLSESLNAMLHGLKEREDMKGEMMIASEIQKQLLPKDFPKNMESELEFGKFYKAMTGVGGDYFDFIPLGDSKVVICIGDVSNHGVGPGMIMALLRAQLHSIIRKGETNPKKILIELNDTLFADTPDTMFVTFFLAIFDKTTNELRYSSAGHTKPIIFRSADQSLKFLKAGGLPLGMDDREFFESTIELIATKLEKGDVLFHYTDGLTEAMNASKEQFGVERLGAVLKTSISQKPNEVILAVGKSLEDFTKKKVFSETNSEFHDDIAMILVQRRK